MKNIRVINKITNMIYGSSKADDATLNIFYENIKNGKYGKPERWVRVSQLEEYEKAIVPMATREVTSEFMGGIVTEVEVKLPADYIVEINEHIPDYRVLRLKEYPAIADCIVAILENMEGRPQALNDLLEYRQEIKNKYPKPINDLK